MNSVDDLQHVCGSYCSVVIKIHYVPLRCGGQFVSSALI